MTGQTTLSQTSIGKCYLIMFAFSGILTVSNVLFGLPMIILSLLFVIFSFYHYIKNVDFTNKHEFKKGAFWSLLWIIGLFHFGAHYWMDRYYDYDTSETDLTKNNYHRSHGLIFDSTVHLVYGLWIHILLITFDEYKLIFLRLNCTMIIHMLLSFHHIFSFFHVFGWYYFTSAMSIYSVHYFFTIILGTCAGIQMFTQLTLFWNDKINLKLSPSSKYQYLFFQFLHVFFTIASSHTYLSNDDFSRNGALFSFFLFSLSPLKVLF